VAWVVAWFDQRPARRLIDQLLPLSIFLNLVYQISLSVKTPYSPGFSIPSVGLSIFLLLSIFVT
jgi:hypothetical protein